jgi:hypothetical protein
MKQPSAHPHSTAATLAQALWLSDYQLLDTCTGRRDIDRKTGLRIALRNAGLRDEHRARHVAEEILDARPALFDVVDRLCARMFTLERGLPTVRREPLARRLVRLVDPDALLSLHPSLAFPNGERYDWPALPLGTDDGSGLLRDGSVDTHIHLGGSLPPLFYWMALVGGDLPLEALPSLGTPGRGHAGRKPWQQAVATAVHDRLALAYWLLHCGHWSLASTMPPASVSCCASWRRACAGRSSVVNPNPRSSNGCSAICAPAMHSTRCSAMTVAAMGCCASAKTSGGAGFNIRCCVPGARRRAARRRGASRANAIPNGAILDDASAATGA